MTELKAQVTTEVLQAFADAWNRHDADALKSFMIDDCVFEASAGPDVCGMLYRGREEVRAGFAEVWATFPVSTGAERVISYVAAVAPQSGPSRILGQMALGWK